MVAIPAHLPRRVGRWAFDWTAARAAAGIPNTPTSEDPSRCPGNGSSPDPGCRCFRTQVQGSVRRARSARSRGLSAAAHVCCANQVLHSGSVYMAPTKLAILAIPDRYTGGTVGPSPSVAYPTNPETIGDWLLVGRILRHEPPEPHKHLDTLLRGLGTPGHYHTILVLAHFHSDSWSPNAITELHQAARTLLQQQGIHSSSLLIGNAGFHRDTWRQRVQVAVRLRDVLSLYTENTDGLGDWLDKAIDLAGPCDGFAQA